MKEQYVGDLNDYRKFSLLRALSANGQIAIGVCWMLTPPDGRNDGNNDVYLGAPERWAKHDTDLFEHMRALRDHPGPNRLQTLERRKFIANTTYFREFVPDHPTLRQSYFDVATNVLQAADLVFYDPDNGIEIPSLRSGSVEAKKFIYLREIAETLRRGKSVLVYQHFPRISRPEFGERIKSTILRISPDATLWHFATSNVLFVLIISPNHTEKLSRIAEAVSQKFDHGFIHGHRP